MNFITELAQGLGFPDEASGYLGECFDRMSATEGVMSELYAAMDNLFCEKDDGYINQLEKVSEKSGIDRYSSDMVFLLMSAKSLYYIYKQNNLSDELFFDTMADLRYKLFECKKMYDIWGTFVTVWFRGFYQLTRFKLGRLQYDKLISDFSYKDALKPGDLAFGCHIPSSGPLDICDVKASLNRAYDFYKPLLGGKKMVVICNSWLLYPPIFEKFKETSNLRKFYDLFDIVKSKPDPLNHDFWRVFNMDYSEGIENTLTADNSLKKVILDRLKSGGTMGEGFGIIVVDEIL